MNSDEQQIRELVATWMSATRAGDIATVLSLMTDDVVFLVAGQQPFGKEHFAAVMKPQPGGMPMPKIDGHSEIQEVQVSGNFAYMWSRLNVEMTMPDGKVTQRAGHTLSVFRKTAGRWQLARDANMLAPVSV
ncbi:MAG TPA: SgcJ/EcaC family oxidoreductase [Steroidobacteraceae bacterium]|nr:SgcJ/EcaC family oxidoreductase [Steroidobacteraceae bacterium]